MDFLEAIRRDSDLFYATADGADPSLPVASCPEWNIADLVWHLGEVQCFWSNIIEMRASDPEEAEKAKPPRPSDYAELIAWGRSQTDRMLAVLAANDDAMPVWSWALNEADHTVGFTRRHQVQEAAVHRWDIQDAAKRGAADPIDPEVASDSIDELLAITMPWSINAKKPLPGSVHLHCTDTEGEWFIHTDGKVQRLHSKGDVAMRGTASDLLLVLYKRVPIDTIEFIGDQGLGQLFIEKIDGS